MLDQENFLNMALVFRERQAGVSLIMDPLNDRISYNAYCLETKLLKDLYTKEFRVLDEALDHINAEFGNWELKPLIEDKSGCGSCVAK